MFDLFVEYRAPENATDRKQWQKTTQSRSTALWQNTAQRQNTAHQRSNYIQSVSRTPNTQERNKLHSSRIPHVGEQIYILHKTEYCTSAEELAYKTSIEYHTPKSAPNPKYTKAKQ